MKTLSKVKMFYLEHFTIQSEGLQCKSKCLKMEDVLLNIEYQNKLDICIILLICKQIIILNTDPKDMISKSNQIHTSLRFEIVRLAREILKGYISIHIRVPCSFHSCSTLVLHIVLVETSLSQAQIDHNFYFQKIIFGLIGQGSRKV